MRNVLVSVNQEILSKKEVLDKTRDFVREQLSGDRTGHDWCHIVRVTQIAVKIANEEGVNEFTVELSALLHDIGDYKLNGGNELIAEELISNWLKKLKLQTKEIEKVIETINSISFAKSLENNNYSNNLSKEAMVLWDADRLDAIGAIGIARTFSFGGFFQRPIHDPDLKPRENLSKDEYKKLTNSTTINHFYEKLLKLKDSMYTRTGRKIAQERHEFLELFLNRFFAEWEGIK